MSFALNRRSFFASSVANNNVPKQIFVYKRPHFTKIIICRSAGVRKNNGDMKMKECPSKAHAQHRRTCRQVAPLAVRESLDSDTCNDIDLKMPNSKNITIENNGKTEEYSITMNDICFIFSIDLRDRYLSKHPLAQQQRNMIPWPRSNQKKNVFGATGGNNYVFSSLFIL